MKNILIILFILMANIASAQRTKQQDKTITDLKFDMIGGAVFDVTGKTIFVTGFVSLINKPKNNSEAIGLMIMGGGCSVLGTIFIITGIKKTVKAGQTKNGVGITLNF